VKPFVRIHKKHTSPSANSRTVRKHKAKKLAVSLLCFFVSWSLYRVVQKWHHFVCLNFTKY